MGRYHLSNTKKKTKKTQRKNKLYTNSYTSYFQLLAYLCI
nr:MAG TPA: hypothetical protein [Caudoviricetes sp.]